MKAKGKVSAEEMLQLTEVGINGWAMLADAMGVSTAEVQKLSEKGLLPANEAINVLIAGMEEKFPGLMKNMENTWDGVTSTIKDNSRMLLAALSANTFAAFKEVLIGVRDGMNEVMAVFKAEGWQGIWNNYVPPDMQKTLGPMLAMFSSAWQSIKQGAKDIGPVLIDIGKTALVFLQPIVLVLGAIAKAIGETASFIAQHWNGIKPILVTVLALFLSYETVTLTMGAATKAVELFTGATKAMGLLQGMIAATGAAFAAFNSVPGIMAGVKAAFLAMVGGISAGTAIATAAVTTVILIGVELVRNWKTFVPMIKAVLYDIGSQFNWLKAEGILAFTEMQYGVARALQATLGSLFDFAARAVGVFGPLANAMPDQFKALYDGIHGGLESASTGLDGFVQSSATALDAAKGLVAEANAEFAQNDAVLGANQAAFGQSVLSDMKGLFQQAKDMAANAFDGMSGASGDAANSTATDWDETAKALQNASAAAQGVGKSSKAAKDATDQFLQTLDPMQAQLNAVDAAMAGNVQQYEAIGDTAGAAQAKINGLNQKLAIEAEIITKLQAEYDLLSQTKGQDAEETVKVQEALNKAIKDQADFKNQITAAQKAIDTYNEKLRQHQLELKKTEQDVKDLATKYREDLAKASADYYSKVTEAENKLAQDTADAWKSYNQQVEDRAKSLRDFAGLFSEVTRESVSGDTLLGNLQAQVEAMNQWQAAMASLKGRKISDSLYKALEEMGPSSVDQIQALANMTDEQLAQYVALWDEKEKDAKTAATAQLEDLKIETQQKVSELQVQTADQLAEYEQEWRKTNEQIKLDTINALAELVKSADQKGKDFVSALAAAIQAGMPELVGALNNLLSSQGVVVPELQAGSALEQKQGTGTNIQEEIAANGERVNTSAETNAKIEAQNTSTTEKVKTTWADTAVALDTTNQQIKDNLIAKWTEIATAVQEFCNQIFQKYQLLNMNTKQQMSDIDKATRTVFDGLVKDAPHWGENLMGEFIRGLRSRMGDLIVACQEVAETIDSYLGFASPTEKGPGSTADQWAPNLVKMFSQGLIDTVPMMQTSLNGMLNVGAISMEQSIPADRIGRGVTFDRGAFEGAFIMDDYGVDRLMDRIFDRMAAAGMVK